MTTSNKTDRSETLKAPNVNTNTASQIPTTRYGANEYVQIKGLGNYFCGTFLCEEKRGGGSLLATWPSLAVGETETNTNKENCVRQNVQVFSNDKCWTHPTNFKWDTHGCELTISQLRARKKFADVEKKYDSPSNVRLSGKSAPRRRWLGLERYEITPPL